jgi:Down syndrome cell adhesion molecule
MRMLVVNEIAKSPYTDAIVIKTQEEAPIEAPSSIQVQAGSIGELIVTWQVPQKLSWNGELLGYHVNYTEEIKQQQQNAINYSNRTVSKTITVHGWATTKSIISGLRKFTKYSIRIRAFNSVAPGPWSTAIFATTLEGIPESPPQNVNCTALSSQSLKISWSEPPPQFHGGIIQGYKVLYRPMIKQRKFINFLSPSISSSSSHNDLFAHLSGIYGERSEAHNEHGNLFAWSDESNKLFATCAGIYNKRRWNALYANLLHHR